jgi:hypothetical protein
MFSTADLLNRRDDFQAPIRDTEEYEQMRLLQTI